jgi:hypothetical protein
VSISASPAAIAAGQSTTLTVTAANATQVVISDDVDTNTYPLAVTGGAQPVSPAVTTTYTATATGVNGSTANATTTVTVSPAPTVSISANPTSITAGQSSTLTVTAANATQVVITDNEDSKTYPLPAAGGTQLVTPVVTTTYTATASGVNGSTATATALVGVPPTMNGLTSFDGLDSDEVTGGAGETDIDPNGAVGTKQFMEYVNTSYQAYSKVSPYTAVWSAPQPIGTPWQNISFCAGTSIQLDAQIIFDRLASRWVIAAKATRSQPYYLCIAVSNTDDLTSCASTPATCWNAYAFNLDSALGTNSEGTVYLPDWPKVAAWPDAYYATMDLNDPDQADAEVGVVACAFDRTNMLTGTPPADLKPMQCFSKTTPLSAGVYLGHSLIPADVDGNGTSTLAPPTGRDEFMASIENPPLDGSSTTSGTINLWDFHLDWTTPAQSTFTLTSPTVATYTPGCYTAALPNQTICVPEPSSGGIGQHVDSVGDRFMPRFSYRNFGSYESFLVSHTVQTGPGVNGTQNGQQTGIRWYELRDSGSGTPSVYQEGTISPDTSLFRFLPSIAQDQAGNAAVGYSVSNALTDPGINVTWWNLPDPGAPTEGTILSGTEEEVSTGNGDGKWGSYDSITVDPVGDCTFWYVNEYWGTDSTNTVIWKTRIANFNISGCP